MLKRYISILVFLYILINYFGIIINKNRYTLVRGNINNEEVLKRTKELLSE
jgi:hypothetical protein